MLHFQPSRAIGCKFGVPQDPFVHVAGASSASQLAMPVQKAIV
jgi:hypothetical protein